uniref:ATP synthase F0 subunit 8 n=1 Tax=Gordius sp. VVA-2019 TaxID=2586752 RepID=A0A514ABV2_9BILA|nr:ATP synthase F0 subunit 8 [Gordius sp. VVA-2019]
MPQTFPMLSSIILLLILAFIFVSTVNSISGPSDTIKPFMVGSVGVSVSMCIVKF